MEVWMRAALALADEAYAKGEVPIGAVVIKDDEIVGRGFNQPIGLSDPTAHAEMQAMRDAASAIGNYRLSGCTLVVTVEPCTMCAGAMIHARIGTLVFGAREPRSGAIISTATALDNPGLNHRVDIIEGILAAECSEKMKSFFRERR